MIPAGNLEGLGARRRLARKAKKNTKPYIELSDLASDLDSDKGEGEHQQEEEGPARAAKPQPDPRNRKRKDRHESSPPAETSTTRKRLRVKRRLPTAANVNNNDIGVERVQQGGDNLNENGNHIQEQVQQADIIEQPVEPDDDILPTVEDVVGHVGALTFEQRFPVPADATIPNRIAMLKQLKKRTQKLRKDRHETGEYIDHEYDYRILIEEDRIERGGSEVVADDGEEDEDEEVL